VCLRLQTGSEKIRSRRLALPFIRRLAHCIKFNLDKRRSTLYLKPETLAIASFIRALPITCWLPLSSRYNYDFVPTATWKMMKRTWTWMNTSSADDVGRTVLMSWWQCLRKWPEIRVSATKWRNYDWKEAKHGSCRWIHETNWKQRTRHLNKIVQEFLSNCLVKLLYLTMMYRFLVFQHYSTIRTWAFYSKTCL
jgi:hypothetical protein